MSIQLIKNYLSEVERTIHFGGSRKETSIRTAFQRLLDDYARQKGLMLIPEISIKTKKGKIITPDGTLKDSLRQDWGYWESKDEADDINEEIRKKFAKDYPNNNILFEDSQTAILFQNGAEVLRVSMRDEKALDQLLTRFVHFERPEVTNFRKAIELFKQDVPKVTDTLRDMINEQERINPKFVLKRDEFLKLCQDSINPDVTKADVHEMMIQHVLTEDIFNTIFDETQFHRENNIARQLESVLATFFTGATRRTALSVIQHYYQVINAAAAGIADHHEKQKFLKVVYETFYKSYNPKAADRLGVVYTPNEIVQFMIQSTDYLLHKHFGKFLEDPGVDILDPATGTGTFVCDLIDYIRKDKLAYKYAHELHANEVAILPYYISNLNIEYTYKQKMGTYAEYENLCFVDTLDNMGFAFRGKQMDMFAPFTEENTQRIKKQNDRKIAVIIGNPPYNAKQENYNFQNANRGYTEIDKRIKDSFIKYGTAQNQIVVYDMYTRFYRWAMDRLDDNGIIAFITNRSYIDSRSFDGFRKSIQQDFDYAYIIDTQSDVRANPKIAGTTHNVFGIQTGVAILFLVKIAKPAVKNKEQPLCRINYIALNDFMRKEDKLHWLATNPLKDIPFELVQPDKNNNWINLSDNDFDTLLPLCDKKVKAGSSKKAIFELFSRGVATQRDEWVYDFSKESLTDKIKFFVDGYQKTLENPAFKDKHLIKWDRELDSYLNRKIEKEFEEQKIVKSLYRPFSKEFFYFDKHFNGMTYQWFEIFRNQVDNKFIVTPGLASPKDFHIVANDSLVDLNCLPAGCQCLPLYRYDTAGNRHDNLTDWGLNHFTKHYKTKKITKEAIFHYVYAVLHHPAYRTKYELNLKREFPRIPLYDDFWQWASWGKQLLDLHIGYERVAPYTLERYDAQSMLEIRSRSAASKSAAALLGQIVQTLSDDDAPYFPPDYQFKVKLKADKENGSIALDERTTLRGIPAEAWLYKLGNRSALEWILDQYKERKPKDPTIAEKFNTYRFADYKEQVIDLLQRVTTVSVETMRIVGEMP